MKTKMNWSAMASVLVFVLLMFHGVQTLKPDYQPLTAVDVPWQDVLCCDSHGVLLSAEDNTTSHKNSTESSLLQYSQCNFKSLSEPRHQEDSGGSCVDIVCRIDENWLDVTCELRTDHLAAANVPKALSFQRVFSHTDESIISGDPVTCEGNDSLKCSLPFGDTRFDVILNINISDVAASPVHLQIPQKPVKPGAPVNMTHHQTIEADLILNWDDPPEIAELGQLRYEVRYSSNMTHAAWQVLPVSRERRLHLDLNVKENYTIQVRCSSLVEPSVWSDWSGPHHIYLDSVSYIPEIVKARPGEKILVYCVFNDHNFNSSTALWTLNLQEPLHSSQYHPVNKWVSRVTVQPSETRMYDLLQCSQQSAIPYSQIYVEGAAIDIKCLTNGDIDAMDCSWKNKEWTEPRFRSRWADLLCEEMEERDRAGEEVGEEGPVCQNQKSCTIHPLRMNCYKLWLEMDSALGPIRSKPIYVSPIDSVKPHTATNVKAVTHSPGVLSVSWDPPSLPIEGVQCRVRYHPPSTVTAQPEWKSQPPVFSPWDEVRIPDMCHSYAVEVCCLPINGTGYWSDWSQTVYSVPQNSRAPEHGPNFWRILSEHPNKDQTTVTLLFEHLQISGHSYCVDGFIIKHQPLNGMVTEERIGLKSSYTFELNQDIQTVTVEAYNSLGRSQNNFDMVLNRQVRRRSLSSFHVMVINSTCVSVSWGLLDNTSVPQFLVLQWSPIKQHEAEHLKGREITWRRLQHTDRQIDLRGDFFGSEEYDFYLYPVFSDGEGQPLHTKAVRQDPSAYMLLMIMSFLSVVLVVTLVVTQNQMKKIVWKDVPNPNKCSWAKGLDLRKVDTFDHLFRPEALHPWPLLVPNESISKVIIMDKPDLSVLVPLSPDPSSTTISILPDPEDQSRGSEEPLVGELLINSNMDALDILNPGDDALQNIPQNILNSQNNSAQLSVTYATVVLSDSKLKRHIRDGSGCSSSDEGNFSANNSDISESLHGALWELESCREGDTDIDNRRSCSYNSVEELSETSEPEDDKEIKQEKDLYYLRMNSAGDESEEEQEDAKSNLLKSLVLRREDCSYPLLEAENLTETRELLSEANCDLSPQYLPQYRTAPLPAHSHLL